MRKKTTISLCMITKNEEKYLSNCIESVKDIIDEIIIVDTGSNDKTVDIAKSYGAKVFSIKWEEDFSSARNYSLKQSTCKWILLLDADEEIDVNYKDNLINLINSCKFDGCYFPIRNYYGDSMKDGFITHNCFRLLKNNYKCKFSGSIHEQIVAIDKNESNIEFINAEILVHHYGYLNENIKNKNKRLRNIPLIEKELKEDPENAFYLYSLGNEYSALNNINKAVELYEKSRLLLTTSHAFAPNLYNRLISSLYMKEYYTTAIIRTKEALLLFPKCIDFHYMNGLLHHKLNEYTLAIDSFNKCIELGETPLKFMDGCGTYRPYLLLGEIYSELRDFKRAITAYNNVLVEKSDCYIALYYICNNLNKIYSDKNKVLSAIKLYFNNFDNITNLILFIDILLTESLYTEVTPYIDLLKNTMEESIDKDYVLGCYYFYTNKYSESFKYFDKILDISSDESFLTDIKTQSIIYHFLISLITNNVNFDKPLKIVDETNDYITKAVLLQYKAAYLQKQEIYIDASLNSDKYLSKTMDLLDKFLKSNELDLFNYYYSILNIIDNKNIYLELGKLYYKNGFNKKAINSIKFSIKEFDALDKESVNILASALN